MVKGNVGIAVWLRVRYSLIGCLSYFLSPRTRVLRWSVQKDQSKRSRDPGWCLQGKFSELARSIATVLKPTAECDEIWPCCNGEKRLKSIVWFTGLQPYTFSAATSVVKIGLFTRIKYLLETKSFCERLVPLPRKLSFISINQSILVYWCELEDVWRELDHPLNTLAVNADST